LVPAWRISGASNFAEVLRSSGIGGRIQMVDPDLPLSVDSLVTIDSPASFPVCMRGPTKWPVGSATVHVSALSAFREKMLTAAGIGHPDRAGTRRLLLYRRDRPRIANAQQVYRVFESYDFEHVILEDLSFLDQVRVLSSAQVVGGATGAAWAGILFAPHASAGICLCAHADRSLGVFPNLASVAGMELGYVFGDGRGIAPTSAEATGFHVDEGELEAAIRSALRIT
jgi:hypothetical protein